MEDKLEQLRIAAESGDMNAMCEYGKKLAENRKYDDALSWFLKAAEQEYAKAQFNLGVCYFNGYGVEMDEKQGFQWFLKAAEQGYAKAQNFVGGCYGKGVGVERDYKEAFQWFLKAAEQGYAEAQCFVGGHYTFGYGVEKDDKEAFQWYLKAAKQGYVEAQFNLGVCYFNGYGVEKDEKQGFQWFLKAAEQGYAKAQNIVGGHYADGVGVERNYKEAFQWFLKAAEQGDAEAQYNVGISYYNGYGVEKDDKQAFQWFLKAAEHGYVEAQYILGIYFFNGDVVEKNKKEAFQWFLKAAEQGYAEAQFVVGGCYLKGVGVEKDEERAYHYIFNVAKNGQYWAQCVLGTSFNQRIDYDTTITNVLELKQQAYANNVDVQFILAEMSFWGNDIVPRNFYEAAFWYGKLLNTDLYAEKAKKRLAFMNYFGLGMGKDLEKAKKLWQEIGYSWDNDLRPEQLKEILICFVEGGGRNTYDTPECKLWDKAYIPLKRLNYSHYASLSFEKFCAFCEKIDLNYIYPISKDLLWNELMNYEEPLKILQYAIQSEELIKAWKDKNLEVFKNLFEKDDRNFLIRANVFFSIREAYNLKNLEPWSIHTHNKDFLTTDVLSYKFDSDAIKSATNILTKKNKCNFSNDLDFAERTIRRDVASCIEAVDDVSGYYDYETRHSMNDILESSEFSEVTNYVKRLLDKKEENSTESNKDVEDRTTIIAMFQTLLSKLNNMMEDLDIFSKDIYNIPPNNQILNTSKQSEDELKELGGFYFRQTYLPKFKKIAEDIKDLSTAYAFMYMLTMSKCFILEKLLTETHKPIVNSINELLRPIKNREISQKLILKKDKYDEIINKYKCKETPKDPWKYIQHFAIELFDLMFQSNLVMTKDMVTSKSTVERQMFKKFVLENDLTGKFISEYDVQCDIKACLKYWGSGKAQLSESSRKKINELTARYK